MAAMVQGPDLIPAIAHKMTVERYRSMDGEACPEGRALCCM